MNKDSDLKCIFHEHSMEIVSKIARERQWMVSFKIDTTTSFPINEKSNS